MPAPTPPSRARRAARRATIAIVSFAVVLAAGCAMLSTKERELTFRPVKEDSGWFSGLPADVREFYLPVSDAPGAERLMAWHWPNENADAPTLLYLHGVRWNLTGHLQRIAHLRSFGFSILAIDYRGFGKSDGELPSEESVYEDALAAWRWVVAREPEASQRMIYGHSLGTAVATHLAVDAGQRDGMGGLIIEGAFTTLARDGGRARAVLVAAEHARDAAVRHAREDRQGAFAGADRARHLRPARAASLLAGALRGRARSEEARAGRGRQPLQHRLGRRDRLSRGDRGAVRREGRAGAAPSSCRRAASCCRARTRSTSPIAPPRWRGCRRG